MLLRGAQRKPTIQYHGLMVKGFARRPFKSGIRSSVNDHRSKLVCGDAYPWGAKKTYNLISRPHGQAVKTPPSQGGIRSSILRGATKQVKGEPVSFRRWIRFYHLLLKVNELSTLVQHLEIKKLNKSTGFW